ncbi:hypothetical protein BBK36DRAFT_1158211 [Trichoderma citrinoviride]|uniref:Uncharacterized protein n=1 Tax=Trichoderma citrinoviride TaxID=58853 RepID=A0A2T4BDF9_9HYPO|nr:hypothetical protein BBK36DRAFT_1158211 [Trichoderma citrinoviride]PTB67373.1 hypothetical protein BBK36DRAFT_1158211 [Trichoderma citrinoviride]
MAGVRRSPAHHRLRMALALTTTTTRRVAVTKALGIQQRRPHRSDGHRQGGQARSTNKQQQQRTQKKKKPTDTRNHAIARALDDVL